MRLILIWISLFKYFHGIELGRCENDLSNIQNISPHPDAFVDHVVFFHVLSFNHGCGYLDPKILISFNHVLSFNQKF